MNLQEMVEALPGKITDSIKSLFASADEKFTNLQEQYDVLTTISDQAASDLATARQTIASLQTAAKDFAATLAAKDTEIGALKAATEKLTADAKTLDAAAAQKAQELCAAQGVPAGKLPSGQGHGADLDARKIMAEFLQEPDARKRAALWTSKVKPSLYPQ